MTIYIFKNNNKHNIFALCVCKTAGDIPDGPWTFWKEGNMAILADGGKKNLRLCGWHITKARVIVGKHRRI